MGLTRCYKTEGFYIYIGKPRWHVTSHRVWSIGAMISLPAKVGCMPKQTYHSILASHDTSLVSQYKLVSD